MIDIDSFKSTYEREIETKPRNKVTFFVLILLLNLAAFGYTVVYEGNEAISLKKAKIEEFKQVSENLDSNYEKLSLYKNYLSAREPEINVIKTAIPAELYADEYLTLINNIAASHGFVIERMEMENNDPNAINVSIQVQGPYPTMADMIKDLEDLDRLTIIESVEIEPSNDVRGLLEAVFEVEIYVS